MRTLSSKSAPAKDDQSPAPLPMDRIVNSSKLTARRAVSDDRTSRHLATEIQRRGDSGWTFSDRRHNSLQERTSGRSLGPAAEPPRNSQLATGNRPARGGRSPLSKSPLGSPKCESAEGTREGTRDSHPVESLRIRWRSVQPGPDRTAWPHLPLEKVPPAPQLRSCSAPNRFAWYLAFGVVSYEASGKDPLRYFQPEHLVR